MYCIEFEFIVLCFIIFETKMVCFVHPLSSTSTSSPHLIQWIMNWMN